MKATVAHDVKLKSIHVRASIVIMADVKSIAGQLFADAIKATQALTV